MILLIVDALRPAGIDTTKISQDPAVVADYRADPLVHQGKPTLALATALYRNFLPLTERSRELRLPLLLQHGTLDVLTGPEGTRALEAARSIEKNRPTKPKCSTASSGSIEVTGTPTARPIAAAISRTFARCSGLSRHRRSATAAARGSSRKPFSAFGIHG